MSAPRWTVWLLRRLAPEDRADDVVGDLEEAHRERLRRRRLVAVLMTSFDALDTARALLIVRACDRRTSISWIDLKLGLRMLRKHPGLTLVGVVAIAFGIATSSLVFQFVTDLYWPRLGLDEGDRIVEVTESRGALGGETHRVLHDFLVWREELQSVDDVSAYRSVRRNLRVEGATSGAVTVAEISASAFHLARVPPLLGRTLLDADEVLGAPPVVVIGYDVWRTRMNADPEAVGRSVRLGLGESTVVGVMPEGFRFPTLHDAWTPLRVNALAYQRGEGPTLDVLGRLASGVSLGQAQAELTGIGHRLADEFPETHALLVPLVRPFRGSIINGPEMLLRAGYSVMAVLPLLLVALLCANIALMVFARTAARESELVVRSALGAGRGRLVLQLFLEALVLACVGSAVGLAAGHLILGRVMVLLDAEAWATLPYWFHRGLTGTTVAYAGAFTLLGALVVGVVPALKITGKGLRGELHRATPGGGGPRMGGLWTAVIVTQVAVTVAVIPFVTAPLVVAVAATRSEGSLPTDRYLTARLETDRESIAPTARDETSVAVERVGDAPRGAAAVAFDDALTRLEQELLTQPGVEDVTFASHLPGESSLYRSIEMDTREGRHSARSMSVDEDYFAVIGADVVVGRGFQASDRDVDEGVVVVNEAFVQSVLETPGAVGQRLRHLIVYQGGGMRPAEPLEAPWYRIVGVVRDQDARVGFDAFGTSTGDAEAVIYHLLDPSEVYPVAMLVSTTGEPGALAPILRSIATDVDPSLRLDSVLPLDEAVRAGMRPLRTGLLALAFTGALALLLSNAGIYSAMAFAVARRTREIGVRTALGAGRRRIVTAILGHTMLHVGLGVLGGACLLMGIGMVVSEGRLFTWITAGGRAPQIVAGALGYLVLMLAFCALSSIAPTRRALGIQPTEALKAEG
jgi:predicted permease